MSLRSVPDATACADSEGSEFHRRVCAVRALECVWRDDQGSGLGDHMLARPRFFPCITLGLLCVAVLPAAENWQPAQGPLMTKWSKDVTPEKVLQEYPRPLMVRKEWLNLNGLWDYAVTDLSATQAPAQYQGRILVPFCIESALSGVMKALTPQQRLWYRRTFTVLAAWSGQRILLHFGAVDWEAHVFLNGRQVDSHRGGFDPFSVDITKALKPNGPQELVVGVCDPTDEGWQLRGKQVLHPGGAAYTACSGIWQTVWLEPVPMPSVDSLRLIADVENSVLRVTVNGRTPPQTTAVTVTVFDGTTQVASADGQFGTEITPGVAGNLKWYKATLAWMTTAVQVPIPKAQLKLWTPDAPFLYDVTIELKDKSGKVLDSVKSYAGMRTVAIGKDEKGNMRLLLNGRPTMLPGALDQGFWPDGVYTAPTDEALRFDIEAAKELGLAAIRKHIKFESQRYYYWADKLGLLILQDFPSGKEGDPFTDMPINNEAVSVNEMERRTLIQKFWNHPSIICWVMFNEGWGQYDTLRNAAWAKELDPTRLIDEASGFPRHGGGDVHDCHGGIPPKAANRISLDSETLGIGLSTPGHDWPGKLWSTGTYDPATSGEIAGKGLYPLDEAAKQWYTQVVRGFYAEMWRSKDHTGSSGDFKVQLYDVETECNGLLSYDRAVWKVDPAPIRLACRNEIPDYETVDLVPCSLTQQTKWRYTTDKPAADWFAPNFDDKAWKDGLSGFNGGAKVGTPWTTPDIWLRKEFTLNASPKAPILRILHDEDATVYLNGEPAALAPGVEGYTWYEISAKAAATLKPGRNVIAVRCHQTVGGQNLDVGLMDITARIDPVKRPFMTR